MVLAHHLAGLRVLDFVLVRVVIRVPLPVVMDAPILVPTDVLIDVLIHAPDVLLDAEVIVRANVVESVDFNALRALARVPAIAMGAQDHALIHVQAHVRIRAQDHVLNNVQRIADRRAVKIVLMVVPMAVRRNVSVAVVINAVAHALPDALQDAQLHVKKIVKITVARCVVPIVKEFVQAAPVAVVIHALQRVQIPLMAQHQILQGVLPDALAVMVLVAHVEVLVEKDALAVAVRVRPVVVRIAHLV